MTREEIKAAADASWGQQEMDAPKAPKVEEATWAIVELLGHLRLAGKLTEEEKFGGKLGRLDIPEGEGFISQFFGASSVYRITIVTEQVARHTNKSTTPAPVSPWDFPKQLTRAAVEDTDEHDPYEDSE